MIVRRIDVDGDWTFGSGVSNYLRDNQAIAQNIATRLRSFVNDCFFDTQAGVDWFNFLGSKNQVGLILAIKLVIMNTQNVTSLNDLNTVLDPVSRNLSITYSVNTVFTVQEPLTQTVQVT